MASTPKDPLLLAGKGLVILMQAGLALGGIALLVAIPAVAIYRDEVHKAFASEVHDPSVALPLYALIGVMLIGLAIVAVLFFFFDRLRRIIATVGEGDPFQPENGTRLSQMGWAMLAVQVLTIPALGLLHPLARALEKVEGAHIAASGKIDFGLLLMTIVLFILARVFRRGAEMRDELEGTV